QYDADGLPVHVGAMSLTRSAQTGQVTATTLASTADSTAYDAFAAPIQYAATFNGSTLYSETMTRDALGRIASRTESVGATAHTFSYSYDRAGRLTGVSQDGTQVATYVYDSNGNRVGGAAAASYDARDRLTQLGSTSYINSPDGERLSST